MSDETAEGERDSLRGLEPCALFLFPTHVTVLLRVTQVYTTIYEDDAYFLMDTRARMKYMFKLPTRKKLIVWSVWVAELEVDMVMCACFHQHEEDIRIFINEHVARRGGGKFNIWSGTVKKAIPFLVKAVASKAVTLGWNVLLGVLEGKI